MSNLLGLDIELYVYCFGKLKVSGKAKPGEAYVVIGFKIKIHREHNYVFPLLRG